MIVVCDLDGTLCDVNHRIEYAKLAQWDEFHSRCVLDPVRANTYALVQTLHSAGCSIMFATGRSEKWRPETESWLAAHRIQYDGLYMRRADDFRPDYKTKEDMSLLFDPQEVLVVLEDRDRVVKMWRSRGFTCHQVAEEL